MNPYKQRIHCLANDTAERECDRRVHPEAQLTVISEVMEYAATWDKRVFRFAICERIRCFSVFVE